MRSFKVGDKVRWYQRNGRPMWNVDTIRAGQEIPLGKGRWVEDRVSQISGSTFKAGGWWWPQPGDPQSCYGEPGYLELVEAAPEPKYHIEEIVSGTVPVSCFYLIDDCGNVVVLVPGSCRAELEALCKKLNEQE
jgi:hypothetical protein